MRFLVPEGEDQHPLTRRLPGYNTACPDLLSSPCRSTLAAVGWTGLLAIRGRALPGTFLKTTAVFSVLDLSWTTCHLYGRQEVNRAAFKLDGVQAKPGKLWERTEEPAPTVEDWVLNGAVGGAFLAQSRRVLPGVGGWSRFVGLVTVGMAVGYQVGHVFPPWVPEETRARSLAEALATRLHTYMRITMNAEAKASLSPLGRLSLAWETSRPVTLYRFRGLLAQKLADEAAEENNNDNDNNNNTGLVAAMAPPVLDGHPDDPWMQGGTPDNPLAELEAIDLETPNGGLRIKQADLPYYDFFTTQDAATLEAWRAKLDGTRARADAELQYAYRRLAELHAAYARHPHESRERDVLRRAISHLGVLASSFAHRSAYMRFHLASATERQRALGNVAVDNDKPATATTPDTTPTTTTITATTPLSSILTIPYPTLTSTPQPDPTHPPSETAATLRLQWNAVRQALSQTLTMVDELKRGVHDTTDGEENKRYARQVRAIHEKILRELEALEMLLAPCEREVEAVERGGVRG